MKRIRIILLSVIIAIALVAAIVIPATQGRAQTHQTEKKYLLKFDNDRLVLYENGRKMEEYKDVVLEVLPATDRAALLKGIEFDSLYEAKTAIEDYDG